MTNEQFDKAKNIQSKLYAMGFAKNEIERCMKSVEDHGCPRFLQIDMRSLEDGFGKEHLMKFFNELILSQDEYKKELMEEFERI